ncbi:sensor histidine kinase [Lacticaseibacillus mingshuiensis]|uniref:histidine kinase n=1 Tax=Lacticaseibacillus mingshuiensis TaxID=2799574 RepID=A0ABW4CIM2_9LACO|nr:HAMP domain-containing sensor histidine kinase [Lacticaseibacillus mingshuiensis]
MKLKYLIMMGHLLSILITIVAVVWAVNKMFIVQSSGFLLVLITLIASSLGAVVDLLLLRPTFQSLERLKAQAQAITENHFNTVHDVIGPSEFRELSADFNTMSTHLEASFASLKESEHEKDMMIAQLSHDIKTPITSIRSTVEGILDGVIAREEVPDYLQTIDRQTDRLNNLVEELSYISLHTQANPPVLVRSEVLIDQLLIETLSEFQFELDRDTRSVHVSILPPDAKIISDRDKIARIIYNLINNALKYSPCGSSLEISATLADQQLQIAVTDHGIGIRPSDLEDVFKRLYRAETSRSTKTGGHGLGLYIAQAVAHELGGAITVASQLEEGSTFTLTLPVE